MTDAVAAPQWGMLLTVTLTQDLRLDRIGSLFAA